MFLTKTPLSSVRFFRSFLLLLQPDLHNKLKILFWFCWLTIYLDQHVVLKSVSLHAGREPKWQRERKREEHRQKCLAKVSLVICFSHIKFPKNTYCYDAPFLFCILNTFKSSSSTCINIATFYLLGLLQIFVTHNLCFLSPFLCTLHLCIMEMTGYSTLLKYHFSQAQQGNGAFEFQAIQ